MWVLRESYDSKARVLILDLVELDRGAGSEPGLPTLLGEFPDLDDARAFARDYVRRVASDASRVVTRVGCGRGRKAACRGQNGSCVLGLGDVECPWPNS